MSAEAPPTIEIVYEAGKGLEALVATSGGVFTLPFRRSPYCNLDDLLERLLRDYAQGQVELGPEGLPTASQQRHWLRHLIVPGSGACSVCEREREEDRRRSRREQQRSYASGVVSPGGKVIVRRIASAGTVSGAKASKPKRASLAAEDLGF